MTNLTINIFEFHRPTKTNLGELLDKYCITRFPTVVAVDEDMEQVDRMDLGQRSLMSFSRIIGSSSRKVSELKIENTFYFIKSIFLKFDPYKKNRFIY